MRHTQQQCEPLFLKLSHNSIHKLQRPTFVHSNRKYDRIITIIMFYKTQIKIAYNVHIFASKIDDYFYKIFEIRATRYEIISEK